MAGYICAAVFILAIIDLCLFAIRYFGIIIGAIPYNKKKKND